MPGENGEIRTGRPCDPIGLSNCSRTTYCCFEIIIAHFTRTPVPSSVYSTTLLYRGITGRSVQRRAVDRGRTMAAVRCRERVRTVYKHNAGTSEDREVRRRAVVITLNRSRSRTKGDSRSLAAGTSHISGPYIIALHVEENGLGAVQRLERVTIDY